MQIEYIIIQTQFQRFIRIIYCVFLHSCFASPFRIFDVQVFRRRRMGNIEQHSQSPPEKAERNRLSAFLTVIKRL